MRRINMFSASQSSKELSMQHNQSSIQRRLSAEEKEDNKDIKADRTLLDRIKTLEDENQHLKKLCSILAHEVRNSLNGIQGTTILAGEAIENLRRKLINKDESELQSA